MYKWLWVVYFVDMEKLKNYYVFKEIELFFKKFFYIVIVVVVVLCFVGLIFIVVGGVLIFKVRKECLI